MLKFNRFATRSVVLLLAALVTAGCSGGGGSDSSGGTSPASTQVTWFVPEGSTLSTTQMATLFDTGQLYFNVPSAVSSTGEIRGEIVPSSTILQTDAGDPFAPNPANNPRTYATILGGDQVRPRNVVTSAGGYGSVTLDPVSRQLTGFIVSSGIVGVAARINAGLPGSSGSVVVPLEGGPVVWKVPANTALSDAQIIQLKAGAYYFDITSAAFPNGEIRGQLNQQVRFASLKGSSEVPPVASGGSGTAVIGFNPVTRKVNCFVKVSGLGSPVTSAVLRYGDAATNGPGLINLVDSGNGVWVVPVLNNPVLSSAVITAFNNDGLYFNIHTQANPGGELRGQIVKSSGRVGTATLSGAKEVPAVTTPATGSGVVAWNSATGQLSGSLTTDKVSGTAAAIHSGSATTNGPALINLTTSSPVTVIPASGVSFALDIQPIYNANCAVSNCHVPGGIAPQSLLPGVSYDNTLIRVVPGDAAASYFYQRITTNSFPSFPQMPLNKDPLTAAEQNLFKVWINSGALNN